MCLAPSLPKPDAPPPPAPDPVQKTADKVHDDPPVQAAKDLAARLGTNQLVIPMTGINVPG